MQLIWLAIGCLCLALGILGAALPLLPTTPFLLAAAYAFARSSPRLHDWLIHHRTFGPPIRDWRREGAISRKTKLLSALAMAATFALSLALGAGATVLILQAIVLTGAAAFVLTRPTPSSED